MVLQENVYFYLCVCVCFNNWLSEYYEFGHVYNILVKPYEPRRVVWLLLYEPRVDNQVKVLLRCSRGRPALILSYALTANQQKYSCPRTFENILLVLKIIWLGKLKSRTIVAIKHTLFARVSLTAATEWRKMGKSTAQPCLCAANASYPSETVCPGQAVMTSRAKSCLNVKDYYVFIAVVC